MSRRYGAPVQPARHRFVYDNDPEGSTRPDTVPAALRFAETSDVSSGVEQRGTRELAPYPGLTDLPTPRDEPTVVDPPLRRASSVAVPRDPQERRATDAVQELPSGRRHRTISTVPERAPGNRRFPLVIGFVLTAIASAGVGTTLGNGSLERVVGRLVSSPTPRATAFILPISAALEKPREPLLSPIPGPASVPEAVEVPSVRLEDLPLAKQDQLRTKSKRATGARRSHRKKL
jgi:hypothetical protein